MNIWDILQIEPTSDTKNIRRAYAKQLKQTNPEDDPEGFQLLRAAYESAMQAAETPDLLITLLDSEEASVSHIMRSIPKAPEIDVEKNQSRANSQILGGIPKPSQIEIEENQTQPSFSEHAFRSLQTEIDRCVAERVSEFLKGEGEDSTILFVAEKVLKNGHFKAYQMLINSIDLTIPESIGIYKCLCTQAYVSGYMSCLDDMMLLTQALSNDMPAFHIAIQHHRHEHFDALLQHQADINQVTSFNFSPLFIAVKVGNKHAYRRLIELGAKDLPTAWNHTALYAAVYNNDLEVARELIARGSDLYQYAGDGFRTLVYAAARMQHIDVLNELLSHELVLDPDLVAGGPGTHHCVNYSGIQDAQVTALAAAIKNRDRESVRALLKAAADPNRKSIGVPPLHFALISDHDFVNDRSYRYNMMESYHAIIDLLLKYGADINLKSDDGNTFLIKAILSGSMETAIHLIESGANIHIPDSKGRLPIDHARETRQDLLVEYFQQEMKSNPRLTSQKTYSKFLSSYLEPVLRKGGYHYQDYTWWKDKGSFFLVIHLQRFAWLKESLDFCFHVGIALKGQMRDQEMKTVTFYDCVVHAPETAYLTPERRKHKFKKKIGYSVKENIVLSEFIQELKIDFEKDLLPCLESLRTLDDCVQFFQKFPTFGEYIADIIRK